MAPTLILSNHWDTLSFSRRKTMRDTRGRFYSWLFSLVWFLLPKKRKLSKVSPRYQEWSDLGGGIGVCVCVCVCVYVCSFCGCVIWLCEPKHLPSTLYLFYFISASSLEFDSHEFFLLLEKEDQPNRCWSSCIWHQSSSSIRNVSIPSFPLTSFFFFFTLFRTSCFAQSS